MKSAVPACPVLVLLDRKIHIFFREFWCVTSHGEKLAAYDPVDVVERLQTESDGKAVKRLVAAREYLAGHSPAEIHDKYGWPEQTVYTWLDRLESRGLDDGLYDEQPPGRPAKLTDRELATFRSAVTEPPGNAGFDASNWTSALAREYLRREFGHVFSRRHARRLLEQVDSTDTTASSAATTDDDQTSAHTDS